MLSLIAAWHVWFSSYNHDEIEHLHAAWLISVGQLPYRDFLEQHHPTIWFLSAPIAGRFHSVHGLVVWARSFDALCLVSVLALFRSLLRRLHPEAPWQFPTVLLLGSFLFVRSTLEFRPDPLMNAALYAGLLNWVAFLQESKGWRAIAAGASFGVAIALLQKAAVVLGLMSLGWVLLIALRLRRGERISQLVLGGAAVFATAVIPIAGLFAAMRSLRIFDEFWFWNYPFNRFFYLEAHLPQHFSVLRAVGLNVLVDPVLWIAGVFGAWLCARELLRKERLSVRDECRLSLLWLALGYFAFLCSNRFPLDQYFIVLLPLLALFSAEVLGRIRSDRQDSILKISILFTPVILAAILLLYPGQREQQEVQELVLARASQDEAIFVPPPFNPIFRRDGAYFWYNAALISEAYADYCRARVCWDDKLALDDQRWRSSPPVLVLLDIPAYQPYRWSFRKSAYHPSSLPGLWARGGAPR